VFVLGKDFKISKDGAYPRVAPYTANNFYYFPQILDEAKILGRQKHSSLFRLGVNAKLRKLCSINCSITFAENFLKEIFLEPKTLKLFCDCFVISL
jgi:hypothetical protein